MRYIAVFTLFATPVAKGFALESEAVFCLEKAYNDPDLSPMGIYDADKGVVTVYQDEKHIFEGASESLIERLAKSYIDRIG